MEVHALVGHALCCWLAGEPVYDTPATTLFRYFADRIDNRVRDLCRPPLAPGGRRLSIVSVEEADILGTMPSDMLDLMRTELPPDPFLQRDIERLLNVRQQHLIPLFRLFCAGVVDSADQARRLHITDQSLIANRRAALKKVVASYIAGECWRKASLSGQQSKR